MYKSTCYKCGDFLLDDNCDTVICTLCQLEEVAENIWFIVDNKNRIFAYTTEHEKAIKDFDGFIDRLQKLGVDDFITLVKEQYPRKRSN